MSTKTLTDELRSVLLFHALEAPEPSATVDRILNDTVGAAVVIGDPRTAAEAPVRGRRRLSAQHVVAASVVALLLVVVAGINSHRAHDNTEAAVAGAAFDQASAGRTAATGGAAVGSATGGSTAGGSTAGGSAAGGSAAGGPAVLPNNPDQAPAKATPPQPTYAGKALNCATIRGGRLVTGQSQSYVTPTGELDYIFEFLCVGLNGERSASELQVFQLVENKLEYQRTLLSPAADQHLDFFVAGPGSARMQAIAQRRTPAREPGTVLSTTWDLTRADPGDGFSFTVADPCGRADLDLAMTATLSVVPDAPAPAWRLTVRNTGSRACGLEGFPTVRAQRGNTTLATALPTLSGPVGGVTKQPVPPILVLPAGSTATAIIEQSAAAAGTCQSSDRLAVTLPDGASLSPLPVQLAACGLIVHPLVENPGGSD